MLAISRGRCVFKIFFDDLMKNLLTRSSTRDKIGRCPKWSAALPAISSYFNDAEFVFTDTALCSEHCLDG
jgi:hypothetical protein